MDEITVNKLMGMRKTFTNFRQPKSNTSGHLELKSETEEFIFDYQLGDVGHFILNYKVSEPKQKHQLRYKSIPLVRVDINSQRHMCEDGQMYKDHIHIFKGDNLSSSSVETYELKSFNKSLFQNPNTVVIMQDFFKYCNIDLEENILQGALI